MGANGELITEATVNNNNSSNTKSYNNQYGGSVSVSTTATTVVTLVYTTRVQNAAATNVQTGVLNIQPNVNPQFARGAVDSTAAQNDAIRLTLANQYDYIVLESYSMTARPN